MAYKVFISHSDRDQELAVRLSDLVRSIGAQAIDWALESETGIASNTPQTIREADEVIVVVTTHSAENPWLHWQIGLASALGKEITSVMESVEPSGLPPPLIHLRAVINGSSIEQLRQPLIGRVSLKESKAEAEIGMRPGANGRTVPDTLARLHER